MRHILFEFNPESGTPTQARDSNPPCSSATSANTHSLRLQKLSVLLNYLLTTSIPLIYSSSATHSRTHSSRQGQNTTDLRSASGPGLPSGPSDNQGERDNEDTQVKANSSVSDIDPEPASDQDQTHSIDVLLDSLTTLVVRPLLHSFVPLSEGFIHSLFGAKNSGSGGAGDVRDHQHTRGFTEPSSSSKLKTPLGSSTSSSNSKNVPSDRRNPATSTSTSNGTRISSSTSASIYSNLRTQVLRVLHDLFFVVDGMLGASNTSSSSSNSEPLTDFPTFNRGNCEHSIGFGLGFKESASLTVIRELLDVYNLNLPLGCQFRTGFGVLEPGYTTGMRCFTHANVNANTKLATPWGSIHSGPPPSSSTLTTKTSKTSSTQSTQSQSIGVHTTSTATSDTKSNRGDGDMNISTSDEQNGKVTGTSTESSRTSAHPAGFVVPGTGNNIYADCGCSLHRRRRGCPNAESEKNEDLEGMQKLARKDMVWYFCSVLHLLLPSESRTNSCGLGLSELGGVGGGRVRDCGNRMTIDVADVRSAGGGVGSRSFGHGRDADASSMNDAVGGSRRDKRVGDSVTTNDGGGKGKIDGVDVESGHDGIQIDGIRLLREGVLEALLELIVRCQRRDTSSRSWGGRYAGTKRENGDGGRLNVETENEGGRKDAGLGQDDRGGEAGSGVGDQRHSDSKSNEPSNSPRLFLEEEEYLMLLGVIEQYYWLLSPIVQAPVE
ncbi:hypothetical protein E1B28_009772 [Marasmius oreades]|nr:uncharacterized protein E1B28_009772 [Marasmius oreades]KAG7090674.1 hypothetical protein E1B28_009772 [Marasmius oreades]